LLIVATSYWPAGEVLADLVSDVVLGQHGEVDRDAGVLGEVVRGELLQVLELRVVHHQDVDRVLGAAAPAARAGARGRGQEHRGQQAAIPQ
jgi:hypothetical protein